MLDTIFDQDGHNRSEALANRGISLLASAALHLSLILAIWTLPAAEAFLRPVPEPDQLMPPPVRRTIYFRFPKKLPNIDPQKRIGREATPAGERPSPNVMIADLVADSRKQLIYQPSPEQIRKEIPSPNTLQSSSPPPAPKQLVEPRLTPPQAAALPAVADPLANVPRYARRFQPPAPKLPLPQKTVELDPPSIAMPSAAMAKPLPAIGDALAQAPKYARVFQPPVAAAGAGKSRMVTDDPKVNAPPGSVNLAILGVKPEPLLDHLPPGSLPGTFSEAPRVGAPSSGPAGAKTQAPGIAVRDATGTLGAELKREMFYSQIAEVQAVRTLSAPLRPSARMLPIAIEQRFAGRPVYTLVIPKPNLPIYGADWILWFAEVSPPGGAPAIRAPLPERKLEPIRPPAKRVVDLRVQLHVVVTAEGALEVKSVVKTREPSLNAWLLEDLALWKFRPAERDGVAVAVEGVLEVPYLVPVAN